jgi:outer membrane protein TolC
MIGLSISLPWGNSGRYKQAIRRDQEKLRAAQLDLDDYQLDLREELHLLIVQIDAARREALLYRDQIVPRTEAVLESAHSAWMSGQNTFRDILDSRRMLLDGRLMQVRAVAEQYALMSELVLCCGLGDLTALETIGAFPDSPAGPNTDSPSTPD